jgi:hypothetical protein
MQLPEARVVLPDSLPGVVELSSGDTSFYLREKNLLMMAADFKKAQIAAHFKYKGAAPITFSMQFPDQDAFREAYESLTQSMSNTSFGAQPPDFTNPEEGVPFGDQEGGGELGEFDPNVAAKVPVARQTVSASPSSVGRPRKRTRRGDEELVRPKRLEFDTEEP